LTLAAPEDMPEAFRAAWMARDAGALAALFAEDADFVNVVGLWWRDREAIRAAHHYGLTTFFRESELRFGRVAVRRIGADAAVVHARATLTGQIGREGGTAGTRRTVLSFVMAREGAGWVCVSAQNTDIVPGQETFEATEEGLVARDYRKR
jgi:uncharacterized protein (TIGR02246 family)